MPTPRRRTPAVPEQRDPTAPGGSQEQHPALAGHPQREVARRTSGTSDATDDGDAGQLPPTQYYQQQFVMGGGHFDRDHPSHDDNRRAVLEAAIQRGLHPKGDPELIELEMEEPARANRHTPSTHATYRVRVTPAIVDPASDLPDTVTPSQPPTEPVPPEDSQAR